MGVERTTLTIVATIDFTRHTGIFTCVLIVHIRLIDITWRKYLSTIRPAEDIFNIDS